MDMVEVPAEDADGEGRGDVSLHHHAAGVVNGAEGLARQSSTHPYEPFRAGDERGGRHLDEEHDAAAGGDRDPLGQQRR